MTGIWTNEGEGWRLGSPQPFCDEDTLHRLIAENPQILPLAGSPRLMVLGSEVPVSSGYMDILAVESTGRPVIIEVKLAKSPEAKKAIVAQTLFYAASLMGADVKSLEETALRPHLAKAKYDSILDAVNGQDQEGAVDADSFVESMQLYLDSGAFRLVLALDEVSPELERIVAYLDLVTAQALTIDLIVISVYEVKGAKVALPQRVSPDMSASAAPTPTARPSAKTGIETDGSDGFRASIAGAAVESQKTFETLISWAESLGDMPNVRLSSYAGVVHRTLVPRIMPDRVGLATVWNDNQKAYVTVWRSVFEKLAPNSIAVVEETISPMKIGQGNVIPEITDEILDALTAAYREASDERRR